VCIISSKIITVVVVVVDVDVDVDVVVVVVIVLKDNIFYSFFRHLNSHICYF
jgi:hypothetical protein